MSIIGHLFAGLLVSQPLVLLECNKTIKFPIGGKVAKVEVNQDGAWSVIVRERGIDVEIHASRAPAPRRIDLRPPRLGAVIMTGAGDESFAIRRVSEGDGGVLVSMQCGGNPSQRDADCLNRVETAYAAGDLDLEVYSDSSNCMLFATHSLAALASRRGEFASVEVIYADLALKWSRSNEPELSAAALLGRADALNALGRATEARNEAVTAAGLHKALGIEYYEARSWESAGIASAYQGRFLEAERSFQTASRVAELHGETTALVNILINMGALLRTWGNYEGAGAALNRAEALATEMISPITAGRMKMLLGELELARGDPASGLRSVQSANAHFAGTWWSGAAYELRGRILAALGMRAEAYASFSQSLKTLPSRDAPVRVARALVSLSDLYEKDQEWELARSMADKAARIYSLLSLPVEAGWARRLSADIALRLGEQGAPDMARGLVVDSPSLKRTPAYCLTLARAALVERRYDEVLTRTQSEQCQSNGLDGGIELAELRAAALQGLGSTEKARLELATTAAKLTNLAHANTGQALRHAINRQSSRLTQAWLDLVDGMPTPSELWAWKRSTLRVETAAGDPRQAPNLEFSDLAGRQLLGPEPGVPEEPALGPLADRLSAALPTSAVAEVGSLAQFQAQLPEDVTLLRVYYGTRRSVALWLTRTDARTSQLPPLLVLRDALARTQSAIAARQTPYGETQSRLAELSGQLLSDAPEARPPVHLWVWADGLIETAPFSGLTWPGKDQPLIETTRISYLTGVRRPGESAHTPAPTSVRLLVASNTGEQAESALAPLYTARDEGELIPRLRPDLKVQALDERETNRAALVSALQRPGEVVHLASHGQAQPSFLGYAGVWLNSSEKAGDLQFLSWLDIADLRLSSGLAVLNACQLAAGPSATSQGNLSFAAAISNAGVDNVVAAFWPVSDTAATVWVPAFYRALDLQDLDSSAEALRQAQLALRASRHFRHPYYWASLAHFRRLAVPAVEDERAVAAVRQLAQGSADAPQSR